MKIVAIVTVWGVVAIGAAAALAGITVAGIVIDAIGRAR